MMEGTARLWVHVELRKDGFVTKFTEAIDTQILSVKIYMGVVVHPIFKILTK
jgi:hypothetical protein